MQVKHTPGPWEFRKEYCWTIFADGDSIMGNTSYYPWVPEHEADWRLIAAAPELLEALRFLLGVQGADELSDVALEMKADEGDAYYAAVLRSRAAIAKALGSEA